MENSTKIKDNLISEAVLLAQIGKNIKQRLTGRESDKERERERDKDREREREKEKER